MRLYDEMKPEVTAEPAHLINSNTYTFFVVFFFLISACSGDFKSCRILLRGRYCQKRETFLIIIVFKNSNSCDSDFSFKNWWMRTLVLWIKGMGLANVMSAPEKWNYSLGGHKVVYEPPEKCKIQILKWCILPASKQVPSAGFGFSKPLRREPSPPATWKLPQQKRTLFCLYSCVSYLWPVGSWFQTLGHPASALHNSLSLRGYFFLILFPASGSTGVNYFLFGMVSIPFSPH